MKKAIFPIFVAFLLAAIILAGCVKKPSENPPSMPSPVVQTNKFSSWEEVSDFISSSQLSGYGIPFVAIKKTTPDTMMPLTAVREEQISYVDYSATNVQVKGVDEADIVKTDGKYIYVAPQKNYYYNMEMGSGQGDETKSKILIIDAYPPQKMEKLSEINVEGEVSELFIYKDKLVAFGAAYKKWIVPADQAAKCIRCILPPPDWKTTFSFIKIYDVSDRRSPVLEKSIEVKGNYFDSRMIDGTVYAIFQDSPYPAYPKPFYAVNGQEKKISPEEIEYFPWPDYSYNYNIFVGINLEDLQQENRKVLLMGSSQNLYVSRENMYLTYTNYYFAYPLWKPYEEAYGSLFDASTLQSLAEIDSSAKPQWVKDRLKIAVAEEFLQKYVYNESSPLIDQSQADNLRDKFAKSYQKAQEEMQQKQSERTMISKIALDGNFTPVASGEVPGHLLNQFSMDEHNGYFRVATTTGQVGRRIWWGGLQATSNNVYVLDPELKIVGRLEELAPGESIYSARFMGDRLYLVTFKKVDPLFTIDLSDPKNPKVLGKLKIPGYSDYLHPYDENYLIGIGKEAIGAEEGDFAWYQGVKLSLFDVRDVNNPREVAKYEIGDRGTDSYALQDHKAFLFSKGKNLLVIPILLAEIDESKYAKPIPPYAYGDYTFQGAYVFSLSPTEGFVLRGRITHSSEEEMVKKGEYWWSSLNVKRSLYIGEALYTVSDGKVMAHSLGNLEKISEVKI